MEYRRVLFIDEYGRLFTWWVNLDVARSYNNIIELDKIGKKIEEYKAPLDFSVKHRTIRYRRYISQFKGESYLSVLVEGTYNDAPEKVEKASFFVKWIDEEWQETKI